jgi:hypothetical protein
MRTYCSIDGCGGDTRCSFCGYAPPYKAPPVVKPSTPPDDDWESRLDMPGELDWALDQIRQHSNGLYCVDNYRAARIWVSSQRRRYRRIQGYGCCGFTDIIVKRWNEERGAVDIYMVGFNYGH